MPERVRVIGDHPHRGVSGTVRDDLPMKLGMWHLDLDMPNPTMTEGCFAAQEHLRALRPEEDPRG